jgi:hypothetical protein
MDGASGRLNQVHAAPAVVVLAAGPVCQCGGRHEVDPNLRGGQPVGMTDDWRFAILKAGFLGLTNLECQD